MLPGVLSSVKAREVNFAAVTMLLGVGISAQLPSSPLRSLECLFRRRIAGTEVKTLPLKSCAYTLPTSTCHSSSLLVIYRQPYFACVSPDGICTFSRAFLYLYVTGGLSATLLLSQHDDGWASESRGILPNTYVVVHKYKTGVDETNHHYTLFHIVFN